MNEQRELVVVATARDVIEAELYKSLLEGNEIPAFVMDENSEALGMPMSILSQGVPVLVPSDMKGEAERIICEHGPVDEAELERQAESTPPEE